TSKEKERHPRTAFLIKQLFADGRAKVTVLLWIVFFANLLVLYFLNSWLPTVLHDNGMKVETAIIITTLFQIGGCLGAILLGRLFDRRASFRLLSLIYCGAAASIFLIGQAGVSLLLMGSAVFAAGF